MEKGYLVYLEAMANDGNQDVFEFPDKPVLGIYDRSIDRYRHSYFNYFTDIIFTNLMEDLDNIHASYHNLHSMHEGM